MLIDLARVKTLFGPGLESSEPFSTGATFAADSDTEVLGVQSIYACTDTSAPRTLELKSVDIALGSVERPWVLVVTDKSDGAGTNAITITTEGAETIAGLASVSITEDSGSVRMYSDGSNLFVIA